jgi:Uma2 family endonuclease
VTAAVAFPSVAQVPEEQRMLIPATWKEYVLLRDLMDGPGLRMTYLKGSLELMSPSRAHEMWKTNIARLVELFAHQRGVELYGYGSATFKKEMADRGAEPDECYLIGHELRDYPHIVLEVIHSSPLLNKLDVYAPMGVQEVWVFRDGAFQIFTLAADGTYDESASGGSNLLPDLNFAMVARYAVRSDTPRALREFEQEIESGR